MGFYFEQQKVKIQIQCIYIILHFFLPTFPFIKVIFMYICISISIHICKICVWIMEVGVGVMEGPPSGVNGE